MDQVSTMHKCTFRGFDEEGSSRTVSYYKPDEVDALLSRCLEALELDKLDAAEKLEMNKGYPSREPRFQRRLSEATALYDEVKQILSDSAHDAQPRA